jgi:hypothetical protein
VDKRLEREVDVEEGPIRMAFSAGPCKVTERAAATTAIRIGTLFR